MLNSFPAGSSVVNPSYHSFRLLSSFRCRLNGIFFHRACRHTLNLYIPWPWKASHLSCGKKSQPQKDWFLPYHYSILLPPLCNPFLRFIRISLIIVRETVKSSTSELSNRIPILSVPHSLPLLSCNWFPAKKNYSFTNRRKTAIKTEVFLKKQLQNFIFL